ncbi:flagellar basal body rod protein FlgC [Natroniella sulfidigena]|uniref:flagellar basal body rod protein FlgC n=1 Tax=Natroniella sulfidigena TaxID=723921 RepID=UPI00200B49F9|nr:flagellar basal body rod protein FlgC [Natroniella sulfidigena]MCK8816536.1 flagellar basal body rod protein FlgC [Natroniella sulfidigena]
MGVFDGMNISSSGLTAQRVRMDLISNNIANVNTTRTEDGGPYRRQVPVFASRLKDEMAKFDGKNQEGEGVKIKEIAESDEPARLEYNPEHPDANEDGYVEKPNVNIVSEMTDMISATRAYEANVTALDSAKSMIESALRIG